jgi:drug/metabolite transporter (DMT)-like permease
MQIVGLHYTLPSISGFLTSLAVVFSPLGQSLLLRHRVPGRTWAAVFVAFAGISILSQANPAASTEKTLAVVPPIPLLGQILTAGASILFTGQILAVDHYGPKADPRRLTVVMLAVTAMINLLGGLALGGAEVYRLATLKSLLSDTTLLWTMPTLVLFSSVLALHLMNTWQPYISAAAASVVYCLEPVFATLFSVLFGTENLTSVTVLGGVIAIGAVLIVASGAKREPSALEEVNKSTETQAT